VKYNEIYVLGVDEMAIVKLMLKKCDVRISTVWCCDIYSMIWGYVLYGILMSTVWYGDIYCMVWVYVLYVIGISTEWYRDIYCMLYGYLL
jgi:hypothetical protein